MTFLPACPFTQTQPQIDAGFFFFFFNLGEVLASVSCFWFRRSFTASRLALELRLQTRRHPSIRLCPPFPQCWSWILPKDLSVLPWHVCDLLTTTY